MMNDLAWHLKTNEVIWQRWLEHGVNPGNEFVVEFNFYASTERSADSLISGFEKTGVPARKEAKRKLFIPKEWLVTASISQSWTLDALNDRTRQYCRLADMTRVIFDGCGAHMPS